MKIGLLGLGTVGRGAYEVLTTHGELKVVAVADLLPHPELPASVRVTRDALSLARDPEVDLVIEVMGGLHPAYECVKEALLAGKHVVTANKHLMAQYYAELVALAEEKGVSLRYSAAVGGGIPWLLALSRARRMGKIEEVWGVFNGTTNLILDEMTERGMDYAAALQRARDLGFAEADPTADVDGWDARRKVCLSANVAFGALLREEDVPSFGMRDVSPADVAAARSLGCVVRYLGRARRLTEGIAAWVEPAFVPAASREGCIHGGDNVISYRAEFVGEESFFGPGAGRYPTGFAVAQDCLDVARSAPGPFAPDRRALPVAASRAVQRYYVRPLRQEGDLLSLAQKKLGDGFLTGPLSVPEAHRLCAGRAFLAALS
ncbi:MAG: homoserine dehydrogenase [Clostridia bacterium]|nr:homoserine dehydrogenase [Clostridia bacterium]